MWPFKREPEPGEFDPRRYQITDEEMSNIRATFDFFVTPEGRRIGTEAHPPEVMRGLVARGLWDFAEQKVESADFISHTANRADKDAILNLAIQAIKKAYAVHHLPIYLSDLARYLEKKGHADFAKDTYRQFLDAQSRYRPLTYDYMFTNDRDVDEAVRAAERKLSGVEEPTDRTTECDAARPRPTDRYPRAW